MAEDPFAAACFSFSFPLLALAAAEPEPFTLTAAAPTFPGVFCGSPFAVGLPALAEDSLAAALFGFSFVFSVRAAAKPEPFTLAAAAPAFPGVFFGSHFAGGVPALAEDPVAVACFSLSFPLLALAAAEPEPFPVVEGGPALSGVFFSPAFAVGLLTLAAGGFFCEACFCFCAGLPAVVAFFTLLVAADAARPSTAFVVSARAFPAPRTAAAILAAAAGVVEPPTRGLCDASLA